MCGIFGRFAWTGSLGDEGELVRSTNVLSHRGPDDGAYFADGEFFLGHRRLSIIDLSPDGAQPMATEDGRFVVVFNGEIYNYQELTRELEARGARFSSHSDTEVLLHGYREWGVELPKHLVGMFAFAIADRAEHTLFVARDRFGEKPLLLTETSHSVTFASELSALARLPDVSRELDRGALSEYLCLNYVPGERTLLRSVRRLAPGSHRLYRRGVASSGRYWDPPAIDADPPRLGLDDATAELGRRLDRSVNIALRADVPVALFLSGGIDSSAVAESAVRQGSLRHAYCLDFAEASFSELPNAQRVADRLGVELRRVVLSADDLVDFSALVSHADDPLADSSALPVYTLARAVAKDYKVAISGDGGDELFGGYLTYQATRVHGSIVSRLPRGVRRSLAALSARLPVGDAKVTLGYKLMRLLRAADLTAGEAHFTWNGAFLPVDAARLLRDEGMLPNLSSRHFVSAHPTLSELQRVDASDYLPNDILTKVDRMTMAHGLEARAPLLVPEVAEYGLSLPDSLKLRGLGPPKRILRHLVTTRLGPEIGHAKKQGFSIPVHRWLRGPLRGALEDTLNRRSLDAIGALRTDLVLEEKERHLAGESQLGFELWGLMVLVEWHRQRVLSHAEPPATARLRRVEFPAP